MSAVGTLWKREGGMAWFYSRTKAWKPVEIRGVDPTSLRLGHRYEMDFEAGGAARVIAHKGPNQYHAQNLADHGLTEMASHPAPAEPPTAPRHAPQASSAPPGDAISRNSLMASATGFAKSLLESGVCKTPQEAAACGLDWARLWDPANTPKLPGRAEEPPPAEAPSRRPDYENEDWREDDGDVPF